VLSSSYLGFGHGSLDRDTNEICKLMNYLLCHSCGGGEEEEEDGVEPTFALVGHSTGCQNSVHFVKYGQEDLVKRTKVRFFVVLSWYIIGVCTHLFLRGTTGQYTRGGAMH